MPLSNLVVDSSHTKEAMPIEKERMAHRRCLKEVAVDGHRVLAHIVCPQLQEKGKTTHAHA